jgi:hypothetical protein
MPLDVLDNVVSADEPVCDCVFLPFSTLWPGVLENEYAVFAFSPLVGAFVDAATTRPCTFSPVSSECDFGNSPGCGRTDSPSEISVADIEYARVVSGASCNCPRPAARLSSSLNKSPLTLVPALAPALLLLCTDSPPPLLPPIPNGIRLGSFDLARLIGGVLIWKIADALIPGSTLELAISALTLSIASESPLDERHDVATELEFRRSPNPSPS